MISVRFQGKPFNITVIQVYASTHAEETEVEWFYEDLQDLLELTPKKDVLFIIGDWNAKVGSQEIPGVPGKFGLGVQNQASQSLTEFSQENALVIANTLFQQHKRRLYTWTSPDGQHRNQIIIFFATKDVKHQEMLRRLNISFPVGRIMQFSFFFTKKLLSSLLANMVNINIVGWPKIILYLVELNECSKTESS